MLNVHPSYTKTFNCPGFSPLIILCNTLPKLHHTTTVTTSPLPQGKKKKKRERKEKEKKLRGIELQKERRLQWLEVGEL